VKHRSKPITALHWVHMILKAILTVVVGLGHYDFKYSIKHIALNSAIIV